MRPRGWLIAVSPTFLPLVQKVELEEVEAAVSSNWHLLDLLASCGLTRAIKGAYGTWHSSSDFIPCATK